MLEINPDHVIAKKAADALHSAPRTPHEMVAILYGDVKIDFSRLDAMRKVISRLRKNQKMNILFDTVTKKYRLRKNNENISDNFFTRGR